MSAMKTSDSPLLVANLFFVLLFSNIILVAQTAYMLDVNGTVEMTRLTNRSAYQIFQS